MPLAKYNDMVTESASDRADEPLTVAILPWRARRRWSITNADRSKPSDEELTKGAIPVAGQTAGDLFPAASDLIRDPFRARMRSNAKLENLSSTVPHERQAIEQT
jgi:hypothetical protein